MIRTISRIGPIALAGLVTACATVPPADEGPGIAASAWLARFDEAVKFFPADMRSYRFADYGTAQLDDGPSTAISAMCGRRFRAPLGFGYGAYEGVTVTDYGSATIPASEGEYRDLGVSRPSHAGAEIWYRSAPEHDPVHRSDQPISEEWTAFVDGRFVVQASSEVLLHAALERTGSVRFTAIQPLPRLPATCAILVLGGVPEEGYPTDGMPSCVAALSLSPMSVKLWFDQAVSTTDRWWPFGWWKGPPCKRASEGDLISYELEPGAGTDPKEAHMHAELGLLVLFGIGIML